MKVTFYWKDKAVLVVRALSVHDATKIAVTKGIKYDDYRTEED